MKVDISEEKSLGGILLPSSAQKKPTQGHVEKAGTAKAVRVSVCTCSTLLHLLAITSCWACAHAAWRAQIGAFALTSLERVIGEALAPSNAGLCLWLHVTFPYKWLWQRLVLSF